MHSLSSRDAYLYFHYRKIIYKTAKTIADLKRFQDITQTLSRCRTDNLNEANIPESMSPRSQQADIFPVSPLENTRQGDDASLHDVVGRLQPAPSNLADSTVRAMVSSDSDALNLLFEAANYETDQTLRTSPLEARNGTEHPQAVGARDDDVAYLNPDKPASPLGQKASASHAAEAESNRNALNSWDKYHLVQMGWFTASEAITYIDL
ncbi:hypothetical protein HJFPF1_02357 [Paramyrothecium foliicola]|nr:hypothetical protein HJFPF1_02357 [Paramyrothecium foliicola]